MNKFTVEVMSEESYAGQSLCLLGFETSPARSLTFLGSAGTSGDCPLAPRRTRSRDRRLRGALDSIVLSS